MSCDNTLPFICMTPSSNATVQPVCTRKRLFENASRLQKNVMMIGLIFLKQTSAIKRFGVKTMMMLKVLVMLLEPI